MGSCPVQSHFSTQIISNYEGMKIDRMVSSTTVLMDCQTRQSGKTD